jgi:hypothetical protein
MRIRIFMKQTIAVSNLSRSRFAVGSVDLFDFDQRTRAGVGIVIQGNEHEIRTLDRSGSVAY